MKTLLKINIILVLAFLSQLAIAQRIGNLEGINFQAVAIDENGKEIIGMDIEGKPLYEKTIGVKFSILKGLDGAEQYVEEHTTVTDQYGLFSLVIGLGTQTAGTYTALLDIPWIDADQFLKVEISTKNDGNYKVVSQQKFMAVPYAFYSDDIADDAITTEKILNGEVINEDLAADAVTTDKILNGTIINEDIADGTIDLTAKVTDVLPVPNGGTGTASNTDGGLIVGGGTGPVRSIAQAADQQIIVGQTGADPAVKTLVAGTGVTIDNTATEVVINSLVGTVQADGVKTIDIGTIAPGTTYISSAFPVPGGGSGALGDIVLASVDVNLKGCIMTPYFFSANTIKVAIFNGTGGNVNLGNGVNVKLLIVQ